jgi:hypothetical protein
LVRTIAKFVSFYSPLLAGPRRSGDTNNTELCYHITTSLTSMVVWYNYAVGGDS